MFVVLYCFSVVAVLLLIVPLLHMLYFFHAGIALIEWPSRLGSQIPDERLDVSFQIKDIDDDTSNSNEEEDEEDIPRLVTLTAHGNRWTKRLQLLVDEGYVDDLLVA